MAAISNPTREAISAGLQAVIVDGVAAQTRRLTGCDAGYGGSTNSVVHDFSTRASMIASGWTVDCDHDAKDYTSYVSQCQTDVS
jgi:hypothetical protein